MVQHSFSTDEQRLHKENNKEHVLGNAQLAGKTQTFPVGAVRDLRGVDALGDLLVGGFLGDH